MKKLFFLSMMCFIGTISFGQSENSAVLGPENDPKLAEFKKQSLEIRKQHQNNQQTTSNYFGYDEVLRSYLINGVIPAAVPVHEPNVSKKDYVGKLNQWISENKTLLKPEHKNSLIIE